MLKAGIDEAGRGPWAGPVFASIVILNPDQELYLKLLGVHDSKKVSEKNRIKLFEEILLNCVYAKVKYFEVEEIDRLGIYIATQEVIKQLVRELKIADYGLEESGDLQILIDGLFPKLELQTEKGENLEFETIIDGDQKEVAISAASILAKVRRDEFMMKLHAQYPQYSFDKHKGYGTKLHMERLMEFGPSPVHRKSFKPIKDLG